MPTNQGPDRPAATTQSVRAYAEKVFAELDRARDRYFVLTDEQKLKDQFAAAFGSGNFDEAARIVAQMRYLILTAVSDFASSLVRDVEFKLEEAFLPEVSELIDRAKRLIATKGADKFTAHDLAYQAQVKWNLAPPSEIERGREMARLNALHKLGVSAA